MRAGGAILAGIFADLRKRTVAGASEIELNDWVERAIIERGASPTYKDANIGFPGVICISVNDAVVHSIPTNYKLKKGDVVGFDLVITYKDMKTDSAFTMVVGQEPSDEVKRLLEATEQSLQAGIAAVKPGGSTGDVAAAVEGVLKAAKLGVVRELVGHGIGHEMHEEPEVPNYGRAGTGTLLTPGMTIAIEPMATLGQRFIYQDGDGWTIRTKDGSKAAHFEHTVLVTKSGAEILTKF